MLHAQVFRKQLSFSLTVWIYQCYMPGHEETRTELETGPGRMTASTE